MLAAFKEGYEEFEDYDGLRVQGGFGCTRE
jgi:hypothetical protein